MSEPRALLRLAVPAALTQLGAMSLGVVDTIMVGRIGVAELDAAALGNLIAFGTMIFGLGCIFGMDPVVSQAHGAGDRDRVGRTLHAGLLLALLLSVPIGFAWTAGAPALRLAGQDETLAAMAGEYLSVQAWSLPFFLTFQALRQFLQGQGVVRPAMWIVGGANLFNVLANWALIFGNLGFPEMGLHGAALATASTRAFQCLALAAWVGFGGLTRATWVRPDRRSLDPRTTWSILRFGVPVGLQYLLEAWAFQASTLMGGWMGEHPLGAHVAVLQLASLSFMLPLGISIAASTRVGNLIGAGRPAQAQRAAHVALLMGGAVMLGAACLFVVGRDLLPRLFTEDPDVLAIAATLLPIAAAFQVFDGVQVVGGGVLRGIGSTRAAAVFNAIGYYALGLPLGAALAFGAGWGIAGVWWGLCAGLGVVAVMLVAWIRVRGPARATPVLPGPSGTPDPPASSGSSGE